MRSRKAGFPFATRARKREPCLQRYVSRMTQTENFRSQFFSIFFWEPLFSTFHGTLFIISRKYFSVFRSPHLLLDTPFWTRCFPLVMQSRKAGFPFAARARKQEPCLQRYVSRMTRTENFRSQFFFKVFLETTFLFSPRFMVPCSLLADNIFSVIRSPHSAPTPRYTILDSRLLPCNAISEGRLPFCSTSSEAGALPSDKQ